MNSLRGVFSCLKRICVISADILLNCCSRLSLSLTRRRYCSLSFMHQSRHSSPCKGKNLSLRVGTFPFIKRQVNFVACE
uniref:Uncharacterized protein n=1 Tax=Anguilla anguilla TaxID=7936 RepID=A0A0E9XK24_ANGAN